MKTERIKVTINNGEATYYGYYNHYSDKKRTILNIKKCEYDLADRIHREMTDFMLEDARKEILKELRRLFNDSDIQAHNLFSLPSLMERLSDERYHAILDYICKNSE